MTFKLRNLLFLLVPAIAIPAVTLTTSCSSINFVKTKALGTCTDVEGQTSVKNYGKYKNSNYTFKDLFYGTKNPTAGNYVIFMGAPLNNIAPNTSDGQWPQVHANSGLFNFFGDGNIQPSDLPCTLSSLQVNPSSSFVNEMKDWREQDYVENKTNVSFFSYFCDSKKIKYGNNTIFMSPTYKWVDNDQNNSIGNPQHESVEDNKWAEDHKIGNYARDDNEAKNFRGVIQRIKLLDPQITIDDTAWDTGIIALTFKDGKYSSITTLYPDDWNSDTEHTQFYSMLNQAWPNS